MNSWIDLNDGNDNDIDLNNNCNNIDFNSNIICSKSHDSINTAVDINMNEKYESYNDVGILEYQNKILLKLKLDINESSLDTVTHSIINTNHLQLLNKILEVSIVLCEKNNTKREKTHLKTDEDIHRTSYNFCSHGFKCKFQYKNKSSCRSKHFVYGEINRDIQSVVTFSEKIINNSNISNNDMLEIKKSVDMIQYVVEHMYIESLNHKNNIN